MENVKYIPGDLVKIYGDICRVKGVRKKDNSLTPCLVEARVISDTENIVRAVDSSSVEPIILTPTILENNEWKLFPNIYDLTSYTHPRKDIDIYFIKEGGCGLYLNDELWLEFNYVHELQHLLFGLKLQMDLRI